MEECDLIENEFERMLNSFKEAVTVLSQPPGVPVEQAVLQDLSKNISSASKRIDEIVDNSKMFDQTEEELDEKLRQLDEENKRNQEQFQQVKISTDKVKDAFQQTFNNLMKLKFGEESKTSMNIENNV